MRFQWSVRGILNKTIASATIALMLVCAGIPVYAQSSVSGSASDAKAGQMTDIATHWAKETLTQWGSKGWVKGYADGTFRPDAQISRAEFAVLVNRVFGYSAEKDIAFSDVMSGDWFFADVRKAVAANYLTGYSDGTLRPNQSLSRQEVAVVLARIQKLDLVGDAADAFTDKSGIGDWSKGAVGAVVKAGYMKGYADGTFLPNASIRRAEVITALDRIVPAADVAYDKAGAYGPEKESQKVATNVIVEADGVTLRNMHIVGTLTISEKVGKGTVYLNNLTVDKAVIVRGGGKDSVYFNGGKYQSIVIGNTPGGEVRIVANANTPLPIIVEPMTSGQKVFLDGKFDTVVVDGKQNTIIPKEKSEIQSLVIAETSEKPTVLVEKNATVKQIKADATVTIDNQGTISKPIEGKQAEKSNNDLKGNKPEPLANTTPGVTPAPLVNTPTTGGGGSTGGSTPGTTNISSITIQTGDVTEPKTGEVAKLSFDQSTLNGSVSWSPSLLSGNKFDQGIAYTATITLTAKSGYNFTSSLTIAVNGKTLSDTPSNNKITVSVTYPATTETITLLNGTNVYVSNAQIGSIGITNIANMLSTGTFPTTTPSFDAYVQLKVSHGYVRESDGKTVKRVNDKTYFGKVSWNKDSKSVNVEYPIANLPSEFADLSKYASIPITGTVVWTPSQVQVNNVTATYSDITIGPKSTTFPNSNGSTIEGIVEKLLSGNNTSGILKVVDGKITLDYSFSNQSSVNVKDVLTTLVAQLIAYTPPSP